MLEDHINIEFLLVISYLFKTFRLIVMIVSVSFFIGMFFFIYIDLIQSVKLYLNEKDNVFDQFGGEEVKHIICLDEDVEDFIH